MVLEKAMLTCLDDESKSINFMFNPKELAFEGTVESNESAGSKSEKSGKPKVSFSNIKAYKVTISNILFDTYETHEDVLKSHINSFKQAVTFIGDKSRPPIYHFHWGQTYFKYCFVEKLSYKLTMFLPNGTPVRAVIDSLVLKETDGSILEQSKTPPPQSDRTKPTSKSPFPSAKKRSPAKKR